MDDSRLDTVWASYNPWWTSKGWDASLPDYRCPMVGEILDTLLIG